MPPSSGWLNYFQVDAKVFGKMKCVNYVQRLQIFWPVREAVGEWRLGLVTSHSELKVSNHSEDMGSTFLRNVGTNLTSSKT